MYNFIFWVLYSAHIKDGRSIARYQATIVVLFAIFIHVGLLFSIIKKYYFNWITSLQLGFLIENKILALCVLAVSAFFIYRYYNDRRITKIDEKYSAKRGYPSINKMIVALIIFIPLITVIIILSNLP